MNLRLLLLACCLVLPLHGEDPKKDQPLYLNPDAYDLHALLGEPPARGSAEETRDLDQIVELQAHLDPVEKARGQSEEQFKVDVFADVLGQGFDKEHLPLTFKLLGETGHDVAVVTRRAKATWKRPRPPLVDPRVHSILKLPTDPSYPSGHTTASRALALVLGELAPDYRKDLIARADLVGRDRVLMGVHYPSDVAAGQKLGTQLAKDLLANPAFQARMGPAKAELQAWLQARTAGSK